MKGPSNRRLSGSIAALITIECTLVCGCVGRASNPDRVVAQAKAGLPERFTRQPGLALAPQQGSDLPAQLSNWPKAYGDVRLDGLITAALAANHDLAVAEARLREARAGAAEAASVLWPTIDASGFRARAKQLRNTPVPNQVTDSAGIDLQASWEADVFGGNTHRKRAAHLDAQAAQANVWGVTTALVAEVTAAYLELAGTDERLEVLDRNIAVQAEGARLAQGAFKAGLTIELTVQRASARLATTRALRPPLEQARAASVHRLGVLTGTTPEQSAVQYADPLTLPSSLPPDPHLAPSDLLARRPDVRGAQFQLFAAADRARAARTDLLPKFFISGSEGRETVTVLHHPTLTDPVYFIGASVSLPIFNAGRIRAQIAAADARLDAAASIYRKSLLQALEDVENAYAGVSAASVARARFAEAAEAAQAAEAQARIGFALGRVDYGTLLDVQRERLVAEEGEVQARTAVAVAYTSLFRAFGGGWQ
jgi:NodT family efflux transporter outer membrane factor (OMF) lipoprotein